MSWHFVNNSKKPKSLFFFSTQQQQQQQQQQQYIIRMGDVFVSGFKTGRNKEVTISRQNLEKQKRMLEEPGEPGEPPSITDTVAFDPPPTEEKAQHKHLDNDVLDASEASIAKVLDSGLDDFDDPELLALLDGTSTSYSSNATKTAELPKVPSVSSTTPTKTTNGNESSEHPTSFVGFQTGRNKKVAISEESLRKAKLLLATVGDDFMSEDDPMEVTTLTTAANSTTSKRSICTSSDEPTKRTKSEKQNRTVPVSEFTSSILVEDRSSSQDSDADANLLLGIGSPEEAGGHSNPSSQENRTTPTTPSSSSTPSRSQFEESISPNNKHFQYPDTPSQASRLLQKGRVRVGLSRAAPKTPTSLPQTPTKVRVIELLLIKH